MKYRFEWIEIQKAPTFHLLWWSKTEEESFQNYIFTDYFFGGFGLQARFRIWKGPYPFFFCDDEGCDHFGKPHICFKSLPKDFDSARGGYQS